VILELALMWAALLVYAAGTAMFTIGVIFFKDKLTQRALYVSAVGLAAQTASLAVRWVDLGHGPYLGFYEVASALVLFTVASFVVVAFRNPRMIAAGIGIMPVAVVLQGGSMLGSKSVVPITAKLASLWLFVHVAFANLAFGALVLSFGCAVVYLTREHSSKGLWVKRFEKLPGQEVLDSLTTRYVLVGFLFWGIMIVTGAIWANEAWGRYWSWDPIETWCLIVWIIYAIFLHLRFTLGWRGERLAWFALVAMPVSLFALVGIPWAFGSPHAGIGGMGRDV